MKTIRRISLQTVLLSGVIALSGCHGSSHVDNRSDAALKQLEASVCSATWPHIESALAALANSADTARCRAVLSAYSAVDSGAGASAYGDFLKAKTSPSGVYSTWAEALPQRHPGCAVAYLLAADSLARSGRVRDARQLLDKAISSNPSMASARLARAYVKMFDNDRQGALEDAGTLQTERQQVPEGLQVRAVVGLMGSDLKVVSGDLDECIRLNQQDPIAWNNKGIVMARLGKLKPAQDAFEKAYSLAPELTEARDNWQVCRTAIKKGMDLKFKIQDMHDQWSLKTDFQFHDNFATPFGSNNTGGVERSQSEIVRRQDGAVRFVPATSKSDKPHLRLALPLFGAPASEPQGQVQ